MMLKVVLPKGAKILSNENNELVVELPTIPCSSLSMFTVNGGTLDEFYLNPSITSQELSIHSSGLIEVTDPVSFNPFGD